MGHVDIDDTNEAESKASVVSEKERIKTPREKAVMYSSLRQRALRATMAIGNARMAMYDTIDKLEKECEEWKEAFLNRENPSDMSLVRKLQVQEDALYYIRLQSIQMDKDLADAQEKYILYQKLSKYWSNIDKI